MRTSARRPSADLLMAHAALFGALPAVIRAGFDQMALALAMISTTISKALPRLFHTLFSNRNRKTTNTGRHQFGFLLGSVWPSVDTRA